MRGDVLIQVEGKNKFLGQLGQFRGAGDPDHTELPAVGEREGKEVGVIFS